MKTVEMNKATKSLGHYVQEVDDEAIVVVRNGKPIAVLSTAKGMDAESIALANAPEFAKIIQRSRRRQSVEGGIEISQLRQSLGLGATKPRKRRL
jgi:prevent-host-death family protein